MADRNYIDAIYDKNAEEVIVWEREQGSSQRFTKRYSAPYYFYVKDDQGEFTSIYGDKLKKEKFSNRSDFESACKRHYTKFESDLSPEEKILMEHYYEKDAPILHYSFLDIEVDYQKELGFASPENPYAPINAITFFHQWKKEYVTFAVPPKSWNGLDWNKELDKTLPSKVTLYKTEAELLKAMLIEIEDSDVLSGWNSEFFDMPYMVRRTEIVLGNNAARRWCFQGSRPPKFGEAIKFNEKKMTVRIYGRKHLDFLSLFKKFAFGGRSSYSLKSIADDELKDFDKLEYEGSLESLYSDDFNFFLRYNIRDTEILDKLDQKFKYIDIANQLTHSNTSLLDSAMGTVKVVDTGFINYCHRTLKLIIPDRSVKRYDEYYQGSSNVKSIEGALVLSPRKGLAEWIGSVDINSLYPSLIRALNLSPEKIIGQFGSKDEERYDDQSREKHWLGIYEKDDNIHTLYFDDGGEPIDATGAQWNELLKVKKWVVSAYGTVFDQSSGQGIIPGILTTWYAERKILQKEKVIWGNKADEIFSKEGKSYAYYEAKGMEEFYDKKQMVKKLLLNSSYGALINAYCRFFDTRMGASTTNTGRQITSHMISKISEILTGEYVKTVKTAGDIIVNEDENEEDSNMWLYTNESDAIIYGDTDSCYFKTYSKNKEEAIIIADEVGEQVNTSFPDFMKEAFGCTEGYDQLIKAGREVVADRGIFQAKKKYILRVVNLDGKDVPAGDKKSLKVMGGEIKKSDTPKVIQKFLKDVTMKILDGESYTELETFVNTSRKKLKTSTDILSIGISKSVNKLELYTDEYNKFEVSGIKKVRLPGHVRASINFNNHLVKANDQVIQPIRSGDKIKIFYLRANDFGYTSIAVPGDTDNLPKWFIDDLSVDMKQTEQKLIDLKLGSIFDPIGWKVPTLNGAIVNKLVSF